MKMYASQPIHWEGVDIRHKIQISNHIFCRMENNFIFAAPKKGNR